MSFHSIRQKPCSSVNLHLCKPTDNISSAPLQMFHGDFFSLFFLFDFRHFRIFHAVHEILEYHKEVKKIKHNILINIFVYLTSPMNRESKRKYEKHNRVSRLCEYVLCFVHKKCCYFIESEIIKG